MKRFLVYCLTFICSLQGWAQNDFVTKTIQIIASSELFIKGDSNIREFECVFKTMYLEECREVIYKNNGDNILFKNAILSLKNKGFDCGNRIINNDFHSLLKSKEYPNINLELTQITLDNGKKGKAWVKITIAGIKRAYTFPIDIYSTPIHRFTGKLKLDIKDYNLEPPKKMFGLIVIEEEIEINFDLIVKF